MAGPGQQEGALLAVIGDEVSSREDLQPALCL